MNKIFVENLSKLFKYMSEERLSKLKHDDGHTLYYVIQNNLLELLRLHGKKITEPTGWELRGINFDEPDWIETVQQKIIKGIATNDTYSILTLIVEDKKKKTSELLSPRLVLEDWNKVIENCLKIYTDNGKD